MWGQGKWKLLPTDEKSRGITHTLKPLLCVYICPQVFYCPRAHRYRPNTRDLMGFRGY